MRARMKVLVSFESQQIHLAFICILMAQYFLGQTGSCYGLKYFITLFVTHAKPGWLTKEKACHVLIYTIIANTKGMINDQKFTLLGLVSYMAIIHFAPQGEREYGWGLMLLGLFLVKIKQYTEL